MGWLIEGMKPVTSAKDEILSVRLKNHLALEALRTGKGDVSDINTLIAAFNMAEALARLRIGDEFSDQIQAGQDAIYEVCQRWHRHGRFVFTGPELQAVMAAMEIHDAQIDVCTIAEYEEAIGLIQQEVHSKRARTINTQVVENHSQLATR